MFGNRKNTECCSIQDYITSIQKLCEAYNYTEVEKLIVEALGKFPHSPVPQNLYGILLEMKGDYSLAMKHFRAGWALDPTYQPVNVNLQNIGSFTKNRRFAFSQADVEAEELRREKLFMSN